jgi:hypothetical protein
MKRSYRIKELSMGQVFKLVNSEKFKKFGPRHCSECGCTDGFRRRVFWVEGAPTEDPEFEEYQNLMRYHMKRQHGFDWVFFRVDGGNRYVETAFCPECSSNKIVFDLNLLPDERAALFSLDGTRKSE